MAVVVCVVAVVGVVGARMVMGRTDSSFASKEELQAAIINQGLCSREGLTDQMSDYLVGRFGCNDDGRNLLAEYYSDPPDWDLRDAAEEAYMQRDLTDEDLTRMCDVMRESESSGAPMGVTRGSNWRIYGDAVATLEEIQSLLGGEIRLSSDVYGCSKVAS